MDAIAAAFTFIPAIRIPENLMIPNHLKFIYIMILKHNQSIISILKRSTLSWNTAVDIVGSWEGGEQALALEKEARIFINKYGILRDSDQKEINQ